MTEPTPRGQVTSWVCAAIEISHLHEAPTKLSTGVRKPGRLENLLLKPYLWQRPLQLVKRTRVALTGAVDPLLVELPWGLAIECHPHEMLGSSLARTGVFEVATTEVLMRLADPGELALDVGANIGYMTSVLAAKLGHEGRVIAFEPNPSVYELLIANVKRWSQSDVAQIDTSSRAISDRSGTAELALPDGAGDNQGTATISMPAASFPAYGSVTVETLTLDELIPLERVGVLKLDVEGHEEAVLRGASRLLSECRIRDVVFEDHNSYPNATTTFLEQAGYSVFTLVQRPFTVKLLAPQRHEAYASWDAPMRLATRSPRRAQDRLRRWGWTCLRTGARVQTAKRA